MGAQILALLKNQNHKALCACIYIVSVYNGERNKIRENALGDEL
jgi:hypothetical protein